MFASSLFISPKVCLLILLRPNCGSIVEILYIHICYGTDRHILLADLDKKAVVERNDADNLNPFINSSYCHLNAAHKIPFHFSFIYKNERQN